MLPPRAATRTRLPCANRTRLEWLDMPPRQLSDLSFFYCAKVIGEKMHFFIPKMKWHQLSNFRNLIATPHMFNNHVLLATDRAILFRRNTAVLYLEVRVETTQQNIVLIFPTWGHFISLKPRMSIFRLLILTLAFPSFPP